MLCIAASLFVGWSIGANDAANSLATAVGARALSLKNAIILICIFGTLGGVLQGHHVIKTIGKGIVPLDQLGSREAITIAVGASFSAGFWAFVACWRKLPISTSHSIVGAVAGAGMCLGAPVKWEKFGQIFLCWILTPIGAAFFAVIIYWFLRYVLVRFFPARSAPQVIKFLLISSGCYVAYSWGANDVANATGILRNIVPVPPVGLAVIGMAAICFGAATWGSRVIETIGGGITQLVPIMAAAAQIASAINVNIYTVLGIPVSTSHSIVGAVLGVGLIHQARLVRFPVLLEIVFSWAVTPLIAGLIAYFAVFFFR